VPPTLEITGPTPLVAFAARGARKAAITTGFPMMAATDPNGSPSTLPASTIACNATIDGVSSTVTAATAFPYGVTVVTCIAVDGAGNVSPAVSFAVDVACEYGASLRTEGGVCEGELCVRLGAPNDAFQPALQSLFRPSKHHARTTTHAPLPARQQRLRPGQRQHVLPQRRLHQHWHRQLLLRLQARLRGPTRGNGPGHPMRR
jgi:hypothetical protein